MSGSTALPKRLTNSSRINVSCRAPRRGTGDKTIAVHPQGRFKADNGAALAAATVAGLGIAALPDFLTEKELASGALVALMNSYPLPEAGIFILRPPGHHPARKVRVLTELLIEHFG
jgi:DNA-binding transcriptional LysR family regulator